MGGGNEGPVLWEAPGSGGTDEDCPPVNELNASSEERTTTGLLGGGEEESAGTAHPRLGDK